MNTDNLADKLERFIFSGLAPVLVWVIVGLLTLTIIAQAAMWAARG